MAIQVRSVNVTGFGTLLAGMEAGAYQEVGLLLVQEHHVKAESVDRARHQVKRHGWHAVFSAALVTSAGGTSGGVAILWRPYLAWHRPPLEIVPGRAVWGLLSHEELGPVAVSAVQLPVQDGDGVSEPQQAVLEAVLHVLKATGRAMMCGGDFNLPPQVLSEWLTPQHPYLCTVYTGIHTCSGRTARELDYFVMTPALLHCVWPYWE